MKALILIDLQNDFLPDGALGVPAGDEVIAVANQLQGLFECVLATQDWHPGNHSSFALNHPGKEVGDVIDLDGTKQVLWPKHCVQDTSGAELASDLDRRLIHKIFRKGTDPSIDSYSGFFDNDHRQSTGLGDYLMGQNIREIYMMGLATDYCVKYSALDAIGLGLSVSLFEDGCRGVELKSGDVQQALEEMKQHGVNLLRSSCFSA